MTKTMFDAAVLPTPTPIGYDVAAGYVYEAHGEAAHIWTVQEWARAADTCRYMLPIATCWRPFGDPAVDANQAIDRWNIVRLGLHWPITFCAIALDVEIKIAADAHAARYPDKWRAQIRSRGYQDIVYSSGSAGHLLGDGPKWLSGSGQPQGDIVIVQRGYLGSIDTNIASDAVKFTDTRPDPQPVPDNPPPIPEDGKMQVMFKIPDPTNTTWAQAVWITDGITYRWVPPDAVETWRFILGGGHGLAPVGTIHQAALANMTMLGAPPHV